mmetsp:Transcript_131544/g.281208  ORF Transcript_131544/g.281208 Transcript_131544/m.281208 type:complete len:347 (-) Transcript_131544:3-1043(-)
MLSTPRPSFAIEAAKSMGCGNLSIDRSRYLYSTLPEPAVATVPMKGITWVMKARAIPERNVSPEGIANSRMQTRLRSCFRSTRLISLNASERSGTLRIPKAMEILSIEPVATPSVGSAKSPSMVMLRTVLRFWASPLTSRTAPPNLETLPTPIRNISELGSTPSTDCVGRSESSSCNSLAARMLTSAVPVAKSRMRSWLSSRMQSLINLLRQYVSNPRDIQKLVASYTEAMLSNIFPEPMLSVATPKSSAGCSASLLATGGLCGSSLVTTGSSSKTARIRASGIMTHAKTYIQHQPPRAIAQPVRTRAFCQQPSSLSPPRSLAATRQTWRCEKGPLKTGAGLSRKP